MKNPSSGLDAQGWSPYEGENGNVVVFGEGDVLVGKEEPGVLEGMCGGP